jgi:hypothetical protein
MAGKKKLEDMSLAYNDSGKASVFTLVRVLGHELRAMAKLLRTRTPGMKGVKTKGEIPAELWQGGKGYKRMRHTFSEPKTPFSPEEMDVLSAIVEHNAATKAVPDANKFFTHATATHGVVEYNVLQALIQGSTFPFYRVGVDPRSVNAVLDPLMSTLLRVDFLRPAYIRTRCVVVLLHAFRDAMLHCVNPAKHPNHKYEPMWHPTPLPSPDSMVNDNEESQGQLDAMVSHHAVREAANRTQMTTISSQMGLVAVKSGKEMRVSEVYFDAVMNMVEVSSIKVVIENSG